MQKQPPLRVNGVEGRVAILFGFLRGGARFLWYLEMRKFVVVLWLELVEGCLPVMIGLARSSAGRGLCDNKE